LAGGLMMVTSSMGGKAEDDAQPEANDGSLIRRITKKEES